MKGPGHVVNVWFKSAALVIALTAFGRATPVQASAVPASEQVRVQRLVFPVVANGAPASVVGYLYYREGFQSRPLQVALHGATYNHGYWDLPSVDGLPHSYARFMVDQGYSVLALDELGVGESDRPGNGDAVTLAAEADTVHQIVGQLRSGNNDLHARFRTLIAVGHSLGSMIAIREQAEHHDFDALVSTGMGHVPHPMPVLSGICGPTDPRYFNFPPFVRALLFMSAADTSQTMVAYDNATFAEPMSCGEVFTGMAQTFNPDETKVLQVSGPVLVQLGDHDVLYPAALASDESSYWPAADITVQAIPGSGHSVNDHAGAFESWVQIDQWLGGVLGR